MSEFQKVSTKADLDALDIDEVVAGYSAGWDGELSEPGSDKSRGYWHGWRNAMADKGLLPHDYEMSQLAREVVGRYVGLN
jgi:hypothetical protein